MRKLSLILALLVGAPAAMGADSGGNFMLGGGVGSVKCPEFVSAMERARAKGIGSLGYVSETSGFTMYLLGFQSGYNMAKEDTYDLFPQSDDYELLAWIENWCRSNSARLFRDGTVALAYDKHSMRLRKTPK